MECPGKIGVREFPKPSVREDAMLLRVEMSTICGTDSKIYEGFFPAPFPLIPGHELVGILEQIGDEASRKDASAVPLTEGDRVTVVPCMPCGNCYYCKFVPSKLNMCENRICYGVSMSCKEPPHLFGGFAEYLYVRPGSYVFKISPKITKEVAVLSEPMANVTKGFERIFEQAGERLGKDILIQGAGPIGILFILVARALGVGTIIVTEGNEYRINKAKEFGADYVINISRENVQDRIISVKELTDGRGVDAVIECTGIPAAVPEGIDMLRRGGTYLIFGIAADKGRIPINPYVICRNDLNILGTYSYPPWHFKTAISMLQSVSNQAQKIVTHKFAIENIKKAFEMAKSFDCLKVAITPETS